MQNESLLAHHILLHHQAVERDREGERGRERRGEREERERRERGEREERERREREERERGERERREEENTNSVVVVLYYCKHIINRL